jgi:hypothetical protein
LIDTVSGMEAVQGTFVLLEAEDYRRFPAPRWDRLTNPWESRYIARRKAEPVLSQPFDVLLVNSWEFVTEFQDVARRIPAAALMDAVPATIDAQLRQRGRVGWKRTLANMLQEAPFARAVSSFRHFLPMGSDCASALVSKYHVPRELCTVTLAPEELEYWTPGPKPAAPFFRLLFVANDFERKGGHFLLRLFTEHLSGTCRLSIVSNDAALASVQLPEGVTWRKGLSRDEILRAYRESDLFVFPTTQDYMPQVLAEALCTALPCMAADVGGIADLVIDGETGFLMDRGSSVETWADRISSLQADLEERHRLGVGARAFAERKLDGDRFRDMVADLIRSLAR